MKLSVAGRWALGIIVGFMVYVSFLMQQEAALSRRLSSAHYNPDGSLTSPNRSGTFTGDYFGTGTTQRITWHNDTGRSTWNSILYEIEGEGIVDASLVLYCSDSSVKPGLWSYQSAEGKGLIAYQPLYLFAGKIGNEGLPGGYWDIRIDAGKLTHKPIFTFAIPLLLRNPWPFSV
jgi:hypothetical protein